MSPPVRHRANIRNWMLTCRASAPSGRRALYRRPFWLMDFSKDRARHYALWEALKLPDRADLVEDLLGLAEVHNGLVANQATGASSAAARALDPVLYRLDVLWLCRRAEKVDVQLSSPDEAEQLAAVIPLDRPTRSLLCSAATPAGEEHAALSTFLTALSARDGPPVERIFLHPRDAVRDSPARPACTSSHLSITLRTLPASHAVHYVPADVSHLREFALFAEREEDRPAQDADLSPLIAALAGGGGSGSGALESLTLEFTNPEYVSVLLARECPERCIGFLMARALPLFGAFPALRSLHLHGVKDLALAHLAALAAACGPTLEVLDLAESCWALSAADLSSAHPAPSRFERALFPLLDRFPALRVRDSVELGVWPFRERRECRCALEAYAKKRGVEIQVEGCDNGWRVAGEETAPCWIGREDGDPPAEGEEENWSDEEESEEEEDEEDWGAYDPPVGQVTDAELVARRLHPDWNWGRGTPDWAFDY
ncbi:hypothetical protein JCM10449v2_001531 [Rhodotorula kratochvilovae]